LRLTGFDPIPTSAPGFYSLRAWDAPLADTSSSALRFSSIVRFDTFDAAPKGSKPKVGDRSINPPGRSPEFRRTSVFARPSFRIPGRREPG
jgi:hypothetical protein